VAIALRACGRIARLISSAILASLRLNSRFHVVLPLALALPVALAADTVRLVGSDLVAPALGVVLQENPPADGGAWRLDLAGTKPGLDALRAGMADIAIVLLESLPAGRDPTIEYAPLAYRAPVVVVSDRNPIAGISLPALAAAIGEGETENHRRWSDLGLPGEWSARTISVHAASADDPLLVDYLRLRILRSPRMKASIATGAGTAAILERLREDESALGILPAMPDDMTGLKALPMALNIGGIPFGPTPENVHAGDYPMRMILAVATPRGAEPRVATGRSVLLSDTVAQALAAHGFVPVPSGVRSRLPVAIAAP
jgi:ABC-type phosphate transport system substrate-binding protein